MMQELLKIKCDICGCLFLKYHSGMRYCSPQCRVSEQIIQVLDALFEKFGIVIDWTSENLIPYLTTLCAKLISYEIWTSVFWIVFMAALTIAGAIVTKKLRPILQKGIENEDWDECGWSTCYCLNIAAMIGLCIATAIVIGFQIMDIIQCATFPEMYIVEYVKYIITSGS